MEKRTESATPLWRKGPDEKPVLCNACGSRYKVKGTLENYLPKNAQPHSYLKHQKEYNQFLKPSNSPAGGINTNLWSTKIPSKKRSPVKRVPPMEKFHKQLLRLWESEKQHNDSSLDNILLFENINNFIPKNEIGIGCILLKNDVISKD
uniref:GATA transcription factor 26-like n=1 Tax=Cicer arietinum TaxID=3827 RepID=A0A3Q7Y373_CICAR|nr:GATA transcription factor 26-like [Cicer arietinum]